MTSNYKTRTLVNIAIIEGGKANYKVSLLEVTDSTFTATAAFVVDFDRDGKFNTWIVNETGIITELVED